MLQELAKSTIGTRRLVLRLLRQDDAAALFALFNDWEVVRWLSTPPWPYSITDSEQFLRKANDAGDTLFAITLDNALIGSIGIHDKPASHVQRAAGPNIGYWLGRPFWGAGYMTEAARAVIAHLFALSRAQAVYSGAFAGNLASLRIQEKLGFTRDGETMQRSRPQGRELPHVNTVLTRERYQRLGRCEDTTIIPTPHARMPEPDLMETSRKG